MGNQYVVFLNNPLWTRQEQSGTKLHLADDEISMNVGDHVLSRSKVRVRLSSEIEELETWTAC
ncbi:hypothetical protein CsatB_026422 [Cannabis sativa]